nr:b3 domain-containing transcription factor vrn1 [Quercus suber]
MCHCSSFATGSYSALQRNSYIWRVVSCKGDKEGGLRRSKVMLPSEMLMKVLETVSTMSFEFSQDNESFECLKCPLEKVVNVDRHNKYVPAGFAKNYIGSDQTVKIQTSDKKHWSFQCNYHHGASKVMRMGNGWSAFSKDNNLQEGDVIVFEVIKRMPIVLGISIFT